MKRAIVTGGAGFIGSNLIDFLLDKGWFVSAIDNLSLGHLGNLADAFEKENFNFVEADLKDDSMITKILVDADVVFHLAANPEVRLRETPKSIFEDNVLATLNVLEVMRINGIKHLVFTSSSTVYGDVADSVPTHEETTPKPISLYGGTKLACEGLIRGYVHQTGMKALILRPANIVGRRATHGVILDFMEKLRNNPRVLEILGDGSQNKSYVEVRDCVKAIYKAYVHQLHMSKTDNSYQLWICNIGNMDSTNVTTIAKIVAQEMGLKKVKFTYTKGINGGRAWKGDVKKVFLDIRRLISTGWKPMYSSDESVRVAARDILNHA